METSPLTERQERILPALTEAIAADPAAAARNIAFVVALFRETYARLPENTGCRGGAEAVDSIMRNVCQRNDI